MEPKLSGPLAIPVIFLIGIMYLIIFGLVISLVAKETVCLSSHFVLKIVCFFFVDSLLGIIILVLSGIGLYVLLRDSS